MFSKDIQGKQIGLSSKDKKLSILTGEINAIFSSTLNYRKLIEDARVKKDVIAGERALKKLIKDLEKIRENSKLVEKTHVKDLKKFLYMVLSCCHEYLRWLRTIRRDGTFLDWYFAGLDMEEPWECLKLALDSINDVSARITFDKDVINILIKILHSKYANDDIKKSVIAVLGEVSRSIPVEFKKQLINSLIPFLSASAAEKYSKFSSQAGYALVKIISKGYQFEELKFYFDRYIVPLLKDEGFFAWEVLQPLEGIRCGESFFLRIFNFFFDIEKKKLLFYFLEFINKKNWPVPRAIAMAFAKPDRSGLPLDQLSLNEVEIIIKKLQATINEVTADEYFDSSYMDFLFEAQMKINQKLSKKYSSIQKLIVIGYASFINETQNPIALGCAIRRVERFVENKVNIFHYFDERSALLLINRLLGWLKNEEISSNAYSLLLCLKHGKMIDGHIEEKKISLEDYFEYQRSLSARVESWRVAYFLRENLDEKKVKESYEEQRDELLEKFTDCKEKKRVLFLENFYRPFLDKILDIIISPETKENFSESLFNLILHDAFSSQDEGRLLFKYHLYFLYNIYTKCKNKRLKYVAIEHLEYFISILYKEKNIASQEILDIISGFIEQDEFLEGSEKIVDFLTIGIIYSHNDEDLKKSALFNLQRMLIDSNDLILKKYILEKVKTCSERKYITSDKWEEFKQCIVLGVDDYKNAQALYLTEKYSESIRIYSEIIATEDSISKKATLLCELGISYIGLGENNKSQAPFEEAVKLAPSSYRSNFLYAKFLISYTDDYKKALELLKIAGCLYDLYSPIYYYKALAYMRLSDKNAAIDSLDMAISMRSGYREAFEILVNLHYEMENFLLARLAHQKILDIDPDYAGINRKKINEIVSKSKVNMDDNHPYFKKLNNVFVFLNSTEDDTLSSDILEEIIFKLEEFVPEDTLDDCKVFYQVEAVENLTYPNEIRRFLNDFLGYVIHHLFLTEYHQDFELFKNKKNRESNIIKLVKESKIVEIYNRDDNVGINERLTVDMFLDSLKENGIGVLSVFQFIQEFACKEDIIGSFTLGISGDMASSYDTLIQIFGLQPWAMTYGEFDINDIESEIHTPMFLNAITNDKKQRLIVFFVPSNIGDEKNTGSVTYQEILWIMQKLRAGGHNLKKIILVFDSYNYLPFYLLSKPSEQESLDIDVDESKPRILNFIEQDVLEGDRAIIQFRQVQNKAQGFLNDAELYQKELLYDWIKIIGYSCLIPSDFDHLKQRALKEVRFYVSEYFKTNQGDVFVAHIKDFWLSLSRKEFDEFRTWIENFTGHEDFQSVMKFSPDTINDLLNLKLEKIKEVRAKDDSNNGKRTPYPALLFSFGLRESKATGPRVAKTLKKIAEEIKDQSMVIETAHKFEQWAKEHNRNFNVRDIQKWATQLPSYYLERHQIQDPSGVFSKKISRPILSKQAKDKLLRWIPRVTINEISPQEKILDEGTQIAIAIHESLAYSNPAPVIQKTIPAVSRTGLKNIDISQFIENHASFILGEAVDDGGCFFDALAQALNIIQGDSQHSEKSLRMKCHQYYLEHQLEVNAWNKKDYGGIDRGQDYFMVQYTKAELDQSFHGRTPIWGRSDIEGKILCSTLEIETIIILEIIEDPETKKQIPSFTKIVAQDTKSFDEEAANILIGSQKFPILVNAQGQLHFVPLLPNLTLTTSASLIAKRFDPRQSSTRPMSPAFDVLRQTSLQSEAGAAGQKNRAPGEDQPGENRFSLKGI